MIITNPNSNFHRIAGEDLFEKEDEKFREYRRKWKNWPEAFYCDRFPLFIDIEVTSHCNLKCPFCATTYRGNFIKKGFIKRKLVEKILDEGAEKGLYGVKFNCRGEPLLHKEIDRFVSYAKKKGLIDVYFNTNAMLLTEDMAGKLIDAGLDRISVSFEGTSKDIYERNRVGANYEVVLKNIAGLMRIRSKLGVDHPKVRIQTVLLPDLNIPNYLNEYRVFWKDKVDEVDYLDYKEMKGKKRGVQYPWACPQLWQRMLIWWDGTILPCNHDDDGIMALGNINEDAIEEEWNSERMNSFRKLHKKGKGHLLKACDGCYLRDSEIFKLEGVRGSYE